MSNVRGCRNSKRGAGRWIRGQYDLYIFESTGQSKVVLAKTANSSRVLIGGARRV